MRNIAVIQTTTPFAVLGGSSGVTAHSPDGITWTQSFIAGGNNARSAIQRRGSSLFIGETPSSIFTSIDAAVTWALLSNTPMNLTALRDNGSYFLVIDNLTNGRYFKSNDLVTYTTITIPGFGSPIGDLRWNGSEWLASAIGGSGAKTSADGITWSGWVTGPAFGTASLWSFNGLWISGADGTFNSGIQTSATLAGAWDYRQLTGSFYGYADNGSLIVAVGVSGVIYSSNDAITWTARVSGTIQDLRAVEFNPTLNLFIACGADDTILTSPDGITWTPRTSVSPGVIWYTVAH